MNIIKKCASLLAIGMLITVLVPAYGSAASASAKKYSQGVTDKEIKIASSQPLTGVAAHNGELIKAGMDAAVKKINDAGGINGRKLDLTVMDDAYDTQRQVANVRKMVEQNKVFTVMTPCGTGIVPASFEYVKEKGIIMWAPSQPADPNIRNIFCIGTTFHDQAMVLANYLIKNGFKRPAAIGWDDEVGYAQVKGSEEGFAKAGITFVAKNFVPKTNTDVSGVVLKSKEANPDILLMFTDNKNVGLTINETRKLGWNIPVSGTSGGWDDVTIAVAGKNTEGMFATSGQETWKSSDPLVQEAVAAITKITNAEKAKSFYAIQYFGRFMAYAEVIKRCGNDLTWENFIKQAETLKGFRTGIFPPITYSTYSDDKTKGTRSGTSGAKIFTVKDGALISTSDWLTK